jgi:hypothetical protein
LIEKCLAHGLSDEQIEGVLREHMFQKMLEQERGAAPPMAAAGAAVAEAPASTGYQPRNAAQVQAPPASSFASRIIAKSQEHLTDEYKAELAAASKAAPPPECTFEPRKQSSVAAKRKARASSQHRVSFGPSDEEIVGILEGHSAGRTPSPVGNGEASSFPTSAYLQSQRQAAEAKNKNRNGSIIF